MDAPTVPATFRELQARALAAARDGYSLDEIDAEIIEPSDLDGEAKAAVWLAAMYELEYHRDRYNLRQRLVFENVQSVDGTD